MLFDLYEIAQEATDRAGVELRTGTDWRSLRRSISLLILDWASHGYNLFTIEERTLTTVIGQTQYTLGADVIDITDIVVRENDGTTSQFDYSMSRMPFAQYSNTANKLSPGRPTRFAVLRQTTPSLFVHMSPDQAYTIHYWVLKMLSNGVTGSDALPIPDRFIPAFIAGLAYFTALKRNIDRVDRLKGDYDETFQRAKDEDRDRASFFVKPYSPRI